MWKQWKQLLSIAMSTKQQQIQSQASIEQNAKLIIAMPRFLVSNQTVPTTTTKITTKKQKIHNPTLYRNILILTILTRHRPRLPTHIMAPTIIPITIINPITLNDWQNDGLRYIKTLNLIKQKVIMSNLSHGYWFQLNGTYWRV